MSSPTSDNRRFSYGGRIADLTGVAVWKFDVLLRLESRPEARVTCYVRHSNRDNAFQALFAHWPEAAILGTGLPLDEAEAESELGRQIEPGALVIKHDGGELDCSGKARRL